MRASVAILGGISILFVGVIAISNGAQEAYDPAVTNGTNETAAAYNATEGVFEGITTAGGDAVVWMGVAAFILIALGLLYMAVPGRGRR